MLPKQEICDNIISELTIQGYLLQIYEHMSLSNTKKNILKVNVASPSCRKLVQTSNKTSASRDVSIHVRSAKNVPAALTARLYYQSVCTGLGYIPWDPSSGSLVSPNEGWYYIKSYVWEKVP